jgi:GxxExxY protein
MRGELLEAERIDSIVAAFYAVYNYYGFGLRETVYMGALQLELEARGHRVIRELRLPVTYKGQHVSWQQIDRVVDSKIILEGKASEKLAPSDRTQVISYLKATPFEVGLLLHFGPKPSFYKFIDSPKRPRGGRQA